jgi:IS5 family transposase
MVHFRRRISEEGAEKIFQILVQMRKKEIMTKDLLIDSTAQEKNITYLTDAKLLIKVIRQSNKISKEEHIPQRQTYRRSIKKLLLKQRFAHPPKRKKEANAALRKLRTIADRLVRELESTLSEEAQKRYGGQLIKFIPFNLILFLKHPVILILLN